MEHRLQLTSWLEWRDQPSVGQEGEFWVALGLAGGATEASASSAWSEWLRLELNAEGADVTPRWQLVCLKPEGGGKALFRVTLHAEGGICLLLSVMHGNERVLASETRFVAEPAASIS